MKPGLPLCGTPRTTYSDDVTDPTLPPLTWMASLRWPVVETVLRREPAGSRVLEFGCGQGAAAARLARMFQDYTGVEPDPESAAVAAQRVEPSGGRILSEPPADGDPADIVCAFEVLEHIEDDAGALGAWLAHARPGALAVFSVPADPDRFSITDELVGHYRRYTDESLAALLRGAGLQSVHLRRYGFPLGYVLEDVRSKLAERRIGDRSAASMQTRSHGSGRLFQPRSSWQTPVRRALTAPFLLAQDLAPQRGPCLVAWARVAG